MCVEFNKSDLMHIVNGAAILGSGGGGPVKVGKRIANSAQSTVLCITPEEAADLPEFVTSVAYIGSSDSVLSIHEPVGAINAVSVLDSILQGRNKNKELCAKDKTQKISGLFPVESGPVNSIVACTVASHFGIPVIDGDGAGRAVPSISMLSYAYDKELQQTPSVLASKSGESVSLHLESSEQIEKFARPIISLDQYDNKAGLALWAMSGKRFAPATGVKGALSLCLTLGRTLNQARTDPINNLLDTLRAHNFQDVRNIFTGKFETMEFNVAGGYDSGKTTLVGTGYDDSSKIIIYYKNENLIVWSNKKLSPLASAPDIISFVTESGKPFTNADINLSEDGSKFTIFEEINPTIYVISMSPHPDILAHSSWPHIKNAFNKLMATMGYPLGLVNQ